LLLFKKKEILMWWGKMEVRFVFRGSKYKR